MRRGVHGSAVCRREGEGGGTQSGRRWRSRETLNYSRPALAINMSHILGGLHFKLHNVAMCAKFVFIVLDQIVVLIFSCEFKLG